MNFGFKNFLKEKLPLEESVISKKTLETKKGLMKELSDFLQEVSFVQSSGSHFISTSIDDSSNIVLYFEETPTEETENTDKVHVSVYARVFNHLPSISLSPWNIDNLVKIFSDSYLLANYDLKDVLDKKLTDQANSANRLIGANFNFGYDKYLSFIFTTELFNRYTAGIEDKKKYPIEIKKTEKGYKITLKPIGYYSGSKLLLSLEIIDNILYGDISYNGLICFGFTLSQDNIQEIKEKILKSIQEFNKTKDINKIVANLQEKE